MKAGSGFLFAFVCKDRSKDGEIGAVCCRLGDFGWSVTGDGNGGAGERARATLGPNLSHVGGGNVVGTQVHAAGAGGDGNVCPRVYEKTSFEFLVVGSQLASNGYGFAGQPFKFVCAEVLLAQLDIVHTQANGESDCFEQSRAARILVAGELGTIADVA